MKYHLWILAVSYTHLQSIHEVAKKLPEYQVSILYVDDGSGDASFAKIKEVSESADAKDVYKRQALH